MTDRCESRERQIATGVAQRADQRPMPAHRVAADSTPGGYREVRLDQFRQLLHHVVVHAVVPRPGFLRGVQVETRPQAEVPGAIRVARHIRSARTGVRRHQHQAEFRGHALGASLLHEVLVRAGESGQPVQRGQRGLRLGLRRQVDGEGHVAAQHFRAMAIALMPAAKALVAGNQFKAHEISETSRKPEAESTSGFQPMAQ
ncbi:hypothetical protein D3C76_906600 [compost metagenome]